jgi:hypothetical protein
LGQLRGDHEARAEAWNFFVNDPDRIRFIGIKDWATVNL